MDWEKELFISEEEKQGAKNEHFSDLFFAFRTRENCATIIL